MSIVSYSACRIQFIPTDRQLSERNYSDRSTIQLRQYEFPDYSLQALDIENNKEEIFNIPFKEADQYKRGKSANQPDEIRTKAGTYQLWLNANSRTSFHEALDGCIDLLRSLQPEPPKPPTPPPVRILPQENIRYPNDQLKPTTPVNRNDILVDVYQLGQHIRQGNVDEAVDLAKKLAKQRVQLQANPSSQQREEKIIQIKVKIDSNDSRTSSRHEDLMMNVYPSTTIRELRSAFEYSHDFPPLNQYFFVNGHMAHENSTMTDLNVHSNSLFVLFLIQQ